jgi:hypothetical protein
MTFRIIIPLLGSQKGIRSVQTVGYMFLEIYSILVYEFTNEQEASKFFYFLH